MNRILLCGLLVCLSACTDKETAGEHTGDTIEPVPTAAALFVFVDMMGQAIDGVEVRYGDSVATTDIRGSATIELPVNQHVHVETAAELSLPGLLYGAMGPEDTDFGTWRGPTQEQFVNILSEIGLSLDPGRGLIVANLLDNTRTGIEGAALVLPEGVFEAGLTMVGMGMEVAEVSSISGMMVYLNVEPGEYALETVMPEDEACTLFPAADSDLGSMRVEAGVMSVFLVNCA
ncbi:MAG: hypothetical protein VX519_07045 [Myxococcota bacterium]|nr:hypothetical protein [Myxococcota bacterium]